MRRIVLFCALLALAGCNGGAKQGEKVPGAAADSVATEPAAPDTSSEGGA